MSNHRKSLIAVLSLAMILAACWKQHDVISIKADGQTTFTTDVIITEKGFSVADIEELSSEFTKELVAAGWHIDKRWVSKSEPYKLTFSGQGNIRQVKSASDFYEIRKLNDNTYSIRFIPAEAKGGKSSRSIEFRRSFLGGGPHILDERGNDVKAIDNVVGDQTYKIVF